MTKHAGRHPLERAKGIFATKRWSSKKRGIEWNFTFDEWYKWWLDNGVDRNVQYGYVTKDTLCMCRHFDKGPYSPENVYCATVSKNVSDSLAWNPRRSEQKSRKISIALGMPVTTPLGNFKTHREAGKAHNVSSSTIEYRIKTKPLEYYHS
jgi:hypothetical protein